MTTNDAKQMTMNDGSLILNDAKRMTAFNSFYHYLRENKLSERTIEENVKDIIRFESWAKENNLTDIKHISYNELLGYVQHLKSKSLSTQTVNVRINSVRKYYEHLKEEGIAEINPARRLFIKGGIRKIVKDVISYNELEKLYQQYTQYLDEKPLREKKQEQTKLRSKVITGLMIWQGIHSGEIKKMEVQHVKLNSGTVYIPSTSKSNSRELKLSTAQIIPLHGYLNGLPREQEKLIEYRAYDQVARITSELKGINPVIRNAQHIRASVIFHWLKMYDKRQVQYMIGHKWISSTEHYEVQDLEGLTDLLVKHHPFG